MRTFDNGSLFSVQVYAHEVGEFKRSFPCSGLRTQTITFQFDKKNGDLVDVHPNDVEGPGALALSHTAQAHGLRKLPSLELARARAVALKNGAGRMSGTNQYGTQTEQGFVHR